MAPALTVAPELLYPLRPNLPHRSEAVDHHAIGDPGQDHVPEPDPALDLRIGTAGAPSADATMTMMIPKAGTIGAALHDATGRDMTTDVMIEDLIPAGRELTTTMIARKTMVEVCAIPMIMIDAKTNALVLAVGRRIMK